MPTRPTLSISFALLILLALVTGAQITTPPPQATAVVEVRANPLDEEIAALESSLVPGPIANGREAERIRSVEMALAVLDRLPDEEVAAIGTGTWLGDRLAVLCSGESAIAAMAWLLCAVVPPDHSRASAKVAAIREALEITADPEHGLISISFRAADPDRAAAIANLFAETYVQQRQSEKQRLRQQVIDWVAERRQIAATAYGERLLEHLITNSAIARAVDDEAVGTAVAASDARQTLHADPAPKGPPSGPSGSTSSALRLDPDRVIGEQTRAEQDEFVTQTASLLSSVAWADPAAVVQSAATPPLRTPLLASGLAVVLSVPVSLVMGFALGRLVDIVRPARKRGETFYNNPRWPQSGSAATPSRGRVLSKLESGGQLIVTERSATPSTSLSAEARWIRTKQEQTRQSILQPESGRAKQPPRTERFS